MEPKYSVGDYIFVDPDGQARHGRDVLVSLAVGEAVTLREFLIEGEHRYLRARNPHWLTRIVELSLDDRVMGVIVGTWVDKGFPVA